MTEEGEERGVTPKLRFPEFQDSGEWLSISFGEVYLFKSTNTLSRDQLNYNQGSIKNIHYGDIHTKFSTLFDAAKEQVPFINEDQMTLKFTSDNCCAPGDMVFADASEDIHDIGKCIEIVNTNSQKIVCGLHTIFAKQKKNDLWLGFGGYLFRSSRIRLQIQKESQGTKVLGLSSKRLAGIEIFFPEDKKEQQKIADCLSSLDELITAHTQKLGKLKAHKKGLMQQLFPAEGETVPKLRFPEFRNAGEWKEYSFYDLLEEILDFRGRTPLKLGMAWGNGNIISLSANNVKNGFIDYKAECNLGSQLLYEKWMGKVALEKGDIIFTMEAPLGNALLIIDSQKYILSQRVVAFKTKNNIDNNFLIQIIWGVKFQLDIQKLATGSTAKGISQKSLQSVSVRIPSKSEQKKIASCLSLVDEQISAKALKIESLKFHKKGLMQQLFPVLSEAR